MADTPPCPMRAQNHPHDTHEWNAGEGRCPGFSEPEEFASEPAPPQTAEERARDLEYVIQRVREAVGTDAILVSCEEHTTRITALETTLRDVLAQFVHDTHPGRPCKQTGHINVETIRRWHNVLNGEGEMDAAAEAQRRPAKPVDPAWWRAQLRTAPYADPDDAPLAAAEPDYAALIQAVRETLGIDLTAGTPHVAAALFIACRELAKSDAAREHLRRDRAEARNWARHGYEIGQRHCGWSDHGVAPAWLTEGWPRSFDSCEHTTQAAEYDTALTRVRGLADRPEAVDPNCPYSDDYLLGYRMAISTAKSVASNERVVIKDAEPDAVCSVCGDEHAPYRDHRKQPFCAACVNCTCRKTVCVRTTAPPTTPAAATGDE